MAPPSKKPVDGAKFNKKPVDGVKFNKHSKMSFKSKKKTSDVAKTEALSLQIEDDVPDFPRGALGLCDFPEVS